MGYANVFTKLDQDISTQIKHLQAKQQELIEKKKNLLATKQKIQGFLTDAQEIKNILASQPELVKSVESELNKIFTIDSQPKLPIKKEAILPTNLEYSDSETHDNKIDDNNNNLESQEEESLKIFKFIDTQGKNTSF
ncbi:hypothetical protein GM3708_2912 [Geminocystis sp. NIES-3708]|uniref:hypothetical protein n=1 Tax=Geminocystis sp. NIES-3708 TaxID=1615909 RepID=UPI0005FCC15E|nr:hypothetical protein [Geminocystis sp. NIES-3708]BAQ62506.1 hypothetical protein GM3708_2912 [Geminocystis sp. NIES-3708]